MATTVANLIEDARLRHRAFRDAYMPDGALLRFVNERVRSTLLGMAASVEPHLTASMELATRVEGMLVALDEDGAPYVATTAPTVYGVRFTDDADAIPYVYTAMPLSTDPWGIDGGGDPMGLLLPDDLVRVTHLVAIDQNGRTRPVEIADERTRLEQGNRILRVFINGRRLIPAMPTHWSEITGIQLSYVQWADRTAVSDALDVPQPLYRVLVAHLAEWLASADPTFPPTALRQFIAQRQEAEAALRAEADAVLEGATTHTVTFRR